MSLTLLITYGGVLSRYALDAPHDWAFDLMLRMYGTLFMMSGAYTLSKNDMVRGDVLYGFFPPRLQAGLDLTLYFVFFLPGMTALVWAGYRYAGDSWAILEHSGSPPTARRSTISRPSPPCRVVPADPGNRQTVRCIRCLRRAVALALEDVEEVDVEKLKAQMNVKDEDIAKLDEFLTAKKGARNEKGSLVRTLDHGHDRGGGFSS